MIAAVTDVSPLARDDFIWPSSEEIAAIQHAVVAAMPLEQQPDIWMDDKRKLYVQKGRIWIPDSAGELQLRLCIVALAGAQGHRGVATTLQQLTERYVWTGMADAVKTFLRTCLHCLRTHGAVVPRPFGQTLHGTVPNAVLHFDFLTLPVSDQELKYVLVLRDDFSGFVELVPSKTAAAAVVVASLLDWFKRYGVVRQWVSDQGTHFKNEIMEQLRKLLGAGHHFVTAYCPWANGTVEVVNRVVLGMLRAMLSELKKPVTAWPELLPLVQSAINMTPSDRMDGVAPVTAFTALPATTQLDVVGDPWAWELKSLVELQAIRDKHVKSVHEALDTMHRKVADAVEKRRHAARERRAGKRGVQLPLFAEGDFVLVGQVLSHANKLALRWKGPQRVVKSVNDYTFEVQELVEPFAVTLHHATRLKFYAESTREVTEDLVEHVIFGDGGHLVEELLACRVGADSQEWEIQVKWFGLDLLEATWEPAAIIYEDQSALVRRFIKARQGDKKAQGLKSFLRVEE